jgi:hypothetical protein
LNLPLYCQNLVRVQDLYEELCLLNLSDIEWEKWITDKLEQIVSRTPAPNVTRGYHQNTPTPESKITQNKYNNYDSYGKSTTHTSGGPGSRNSKNNNNSNNNNNSSKKNSVKKESLIIEIE